MANHEWVTETETETEKEDEREKSALNGRNRKSTMEPIKQCFYLAIKRQHEKLQPNENNYFGS